MIGDNVPPSVISQPDTIVLILQSGQTSVTANWVEPLVTDNSGTVTLLRQSHFSGASRFSVGRTAVEYLYSDPAGNQLTVTFDVIVNDINGMLFMTFVVHLLYFTVCCKIITFEMRREGSLLQNLLKLVMR